MRIPIRLEWYGAAIAIATGLMLGGAMHPDLAADGRPAGPQMIAGWAGMRSTGPFDGGTTLASYGLQAPDYVMGTDAKRAMNWASGPAATSAPAPREATDDATRDAARDDTRDAARDDLPTISRAAYDAYDEERLAPRHYYPSVGGDDRADDEGAHAAPTISG